MLKKASMSEHRTPVSNKKRQTKDYENEQTQSLDVSPPKQPKFTKSPESLFSPSRLIERLSIEDEDEEESEEYKNIAVVEAPKAINKYHNASKVLSSGETNILPGREKEFAELEQFLNQHIENETSGSLYVSGQPGTGKTACISKLLKCEKFSQKLNKVYINCTSISTVASIYKKIKTELKIKSAGKTEKESLAAIEKYLKSNHKQILLVLDEIDQLCNSKQSVLYTIFEWPSKTHHKIILIGIANSLDLVDRLLVRLNAKCNLRPKLMNFSSYSKQQIIDIFKSRLEEANVIDIFPPATIQLLAGKVASISGDIRRALDIGRRVIEMADRDGKTDINIKDLDLANATPNENESSKKIIPDDNKEKNKPVQVRQVASVLNNVYGTSQTLNNDSDYNFPLQQKILLCSLLLMLRKCKNKDITVGRLHDVYRRVCAKRNIQSVDQAEFASLCSLVDTRGIIRLIAKKEPRLSKITLQWDQTEVTDALKDKQLIATILDDDSCLGGR
ncbi:cell division control protein 6 homolog isoform X2 [Condylostylus longicornis]|nr:cell division control protein 6 homolog isoform X2 [Condylostylus longicornis]